MSYRNIVFVKLEKRLLNDYRWYTLDDKWQLLYIKMILLAAETYNKMPKATPILRTALRTTLTDTEIEQGIEILMATFPKIKQTKHFYYIEDFEHKTNWVDNRELPSNSRATPKVVVDKIREDKNKTKTETTAKPLEVLPTPSPTASNDTKTLTHAFFSKYTEATGVACVRDYGKVGKILKQLTDLGVVVDDKLISKFFKWWKSNSFYQNKGIKPDITLLRSKINDVIAYKAGGVDYSEWR